MTVDSDVFRPGRFGLTQRNGIVIAENRLIPTTVQAGTLIQVLYPTDRISGITGERIIAIHLWYIPRISRYESFITGENNFGEEGLNIIGAKGLPFFERLLQGSLGDQSNNVIDDLGGLGDINIP